MEHNKIAERYTELTRITEKLGDDRKAVIAPLITEIVFMEGKLAGLREMQHIRVHPKNPARQEITPAGKQDKETMQAYLGAIKVVMTALYKNETDAADELIEKLSFLDIFLPFI